MSRLLKSIGAFESTLTAAEWLWRLVTLLFIGASGTITGFIAKADPLLAQLGPIYWVSVGALGSLIVALILFLIKSAQLKDSEAALNRAMAVPRSTINPLSTNFSDVIIPIEDLRLPTTQLHERKHFKRCKFVGPGVVAIQDGTYVNSGFIDCGDIVALPDGVFLTGIMVFRNCTVEDCEFIRTTVFVDQGTAKSFSAVPGAKVKGVHT
jgi:hypothetical protein